MEKLPVAKQHTEKWEASRSSCSSGVEALERQATDAIGA